MRSHPLSSLRFRLVLLVLFSAVPALALILSSARSQRTRAQSEAREQARQFARLAAASEEKFIEGAHQLLIALAQTADLGRDPAACSAWLARMIAANHQYANLGVISASGELVCSALPAADRLQLGDRKYVRDAIASRGFAVGDWQIGRITGRPSINFGLPVLDGGKVSAVVFAAIDLDWLNREAGVLGLPTGGELIVHDRAGRILIHWPDPSRWVGEVASPELTHPVSAESSDLLEIDGPDGERRYYARIPLHAAMGDLQLTAGISRRAAIAGADRLLRLNLLWLSLVTVLAVAAAWFGGDRVIVRRLDAMVSATRRLRAGDLDARNPQPYANDEIGELARAFDEMADGLASREAERLVAERQLARDALHDRLTGLPNRALFLDRLGLSIERAQRGERHGFAVLVLDLDRFKVVNDGLGHLSGDQLLRAVGDRLEGCLPPGDTVARLGGDEFAILLDDTQGVREAARVADEIQTALAQPVAVDGGEVFTTASIGLALHGTTPQLAERYLREAEMAMYRAKSLGGARHETYDAGMHTRAVNLLRLETDLRRALEREELTLVYQPIVSLKDGSIVACEALMRWRHASRALVLPNEFIPLAEETGLIAAIGEFALRTACVQSRRWQEAGLKPLCMAVNISAYQFRQRDLTRIVSRLLEHTGLKPELLKLELTESSIMDDAEETIRTLEALREIGVQLSVDDFGTGYSSLRYLRRFPIQTLKIDRQFVKGIALHPDDSAITSAVIALAHALNLTVVAEGVETGVQLDFLRAQHCDEVQGGYFSPPVSPERLAKLLAADIHIAPGLGLSEALPAEDRQASEPALAAAPPSPRA